MGTTLGCGLHYPRSILRTQVKLPSMGLCWLLHPCMVSFPSQNPFPPAHLRIPPNKQRSRGFSSQGLRLGKTNLQAAPTGPSGPHLFVISWFFFLSTYLFTDSCFSYTYVKCRNIYLFAFNMSLFFSIFPGLTWDPFTVSQICCFPLCLLLMVCLANLSNSTC